MARGGHLPFATRSAVKRTPLKKGLRLNGHRLWQSRCNVVQNDKPYVDGVEVRRYCTMRRCCTIHADQREDDGVEVKSQLPDSTQALHTSIPYSWFAWHVELVVRVVVAAIVLQAVLENFLEPYRAK